MTKLNKLSITICTIGFLLCIADIARGQEHPTVTQMREIMAGQHEPAKPPVITSEMREAYFQARGDALEAQIALEAAQKRLQAAVDAMQKVCPLVVDAQGKPQCMTVPEKPEPPKESQR